MKSVLRSWRLLILVWSVLLTPQVALVHALSHTLANSAARELPGRAGSERQHANDKVCDSCLALAQLGAALPAQFDWVLPADAAPDSAASDTPTAELRRTLAFRARAPPAALI